MCVFFFSPKLSYGIPLWTVKRKGSVKSAHLAFPLLTSKHLIGLRHCSYGVTFFQTFHMAPNHTFASWHYCVFLWSGAPVDQRVPKTFISSEKYQTGPAVVQDGICWRSVCAITTQGGEMWVGGREPGAITQVELARFLLIIVLLISKLNIDVKTVSFEVSWIHLFQLGRNAVPPI